MKFNSKYLPCLSSKFIAQYRLQNCGHFGQV